MSTDMNPASWSQYIRLHVPVGASNRRVIREARRLLSKRGRSKEARGFRHCWLRGILDHHKAAQELRWLIG